MLRRTDRLFRRFQETGNPRALGAVFDRTAPELLRVALHLTRDIHRAEDLLQSTFLTAMQKARQYDPRRPLLPWLLAILANHCRQQCRQDHRRRRPQPAPAEDATAGDVAETAAARELAQTCDRALDGLGEPYRHVLILHLRHDLAAVEIARALDRPDSTVRNQIARGMQMLRRALPAGIASGAVLVATGGRGLAAVRAAVLSNAPAVATGAAMAGALSTGVLLMSKKTMLVSGLVAIAVAGAVWIGLPGDEPPQPWQPVVTANGAGDPSAETGSADTTRSGTTDPTAQRTRVDMEKAPGTLKVEVVHADDGTPGAGIPFEVWTWVGGRRGPVLLAGRTARDGTAAVTDLAPGGYFFDLLVGHRPERVSVRIAAGQETAQRIEIARGWELGGIVIDRHGRPLAGASVQFLGEDDHTITLARTSVDGTFTVSYLRGDVTVWAMAPGMQPSKRRAVEERDGMAEVRLVVGEAGSRLTGVVEDENGQRVAGAIVYVGVALPLESHFVQRELYDLRAGDDGTFAADWLPPGRHFVGALPPDRDRSRATARWVEVGPSGAAQVALRLGDGASLVGQVRDGRGLPLAGVAVDARPVAEHGIGVFDFARATTDEEGAYRLAGLIVGSHRVSARRGAIESETEVVLRRGAEQRWDTVLGKGGTIAVRLLDPEGQPLSRWAVELRRPDLSLGWVQQDIEFTDRDGRCSYRDLRPVEHQVRVLVEGFSVTVARRDGVLPDRGETVVRLTREEIPSARIRGRVVDARGDAVSDAEVTMVQSGGGGSFVRNMEVAADGTFATGLLPPGAYSLNARAPGESSAWVGGLYRVQADQELDLGDLVLPDAARLEVRLLAADGAPITAPVLRLGDPRDVNPGASDLQPDEVDGLYRVEGLEPGTRVLRFFAADAAPQMVRVELAPGEERKLDLMVQRAVPVVLELRCSLDKPEGFNLLNGKLAVFDAAGERIVFHRLWGYFDDFEQRIERLRLALAPGSYRIVAEEFGGKERELELQVDAKEMDRPFVVDLR